ncbi:plasmid partitioning protein RepB C-terminal domain-containing protein [Sphingobium subterraneum]|uniref:ParB family chromosome partitioning protein n=1 Tax=Sphingobium subterraneum TaxID=627688 RepID=A0A841J9Y4_9SPHN|nr:plasmid partitioning protein RepB C-terminal domain-containing protein [Sphingobium subterraneum]MBB6125378.1 ParB family chromosome partitioning protein [Sphingobium subterraneum]
MAEDSSEDVVMVPLDRVTVLNPRTRDQRQHADIVENINTIGLKRPITVRQRQGADGLPCYDVICGEGRLEAFRQLKQELVPVIIRDASEEDCLIMGLVENLARPHHRPIDLMAEIGSLQQRGYSDTEIAAKIGVTVSWINMISQLLSKGEERLVSAVETGLIPISLATDIARSSDAEIQNVLADAYEQGKIRGKKLGKIRRMLEQRQLRSKRLPDGGLGVRKKSHKLTPDELLRLYQREAEKQQLVVKRSDFTRSRLSFVVEALRDMTADEGFVTLLRAENLNTLPKWLDDKLCEHQVASWR